MIMVRGREHLAQVDQTMIIPLYVVTFWALLFVGCGPIVAQSVAVFDFELIDTSLEGAIRGARPDEQERLARVINCGSYSGTRAACRSSISLRSHARRRQATCKPVVAAICTWPDASGPNSRSPAPCKRYRI